MALQYNYGVCTNMDCEDGNPCPLCASKEKQKILSTRDFVCRECGEPLTKVNGTDGGSNWVKYACIGVGIVAALGVGGFGIYKAISPSQPKEVSLNHTEKTLYVGDKDTLVANILPDKCEGTLVWKVSKGGGVVVNDGIVTAVKVGEGKVQVTVQGVDGIEAICVYTIKEKEKGLNRILPKEISLNHTVKTLYVGEKDTLVASLLPAKSEGTLVWKASENKVLAIDNGVVTALEEGEGKIQVSVQGVDDVEATCVYNIKKKETPRDSGSGGGKTPPPPRHESGNLGYGTFSGPVKNRQPNGRGTLRYKAPHLIDSRDPKGRVALPGDYVIGEWKNGKLIQGTWFDSSNNSKGSIIIGL